MARVEMRHGDGADAFRFERADELPSSVGATAIGDIVFLLQMRRRRLNGKRCAPKFRDLGDEEEDLGLGHIAA